MWPSANISLAHTVLSVYVGSALAPGPAIAYRNLQLRLKLAATLMLRRTARAERRRRIQLNRLRRYYSIRPWELYAVRLSIARQEHVQSERRRVLNHFEAKVP
jgi:hypothetical protein